MEQIIKDIENEEFKNDELNLNKWIAEMQERKEIKYSLYNLYTDYLNSEDAANYNFNEFEALRKFYVYLDKKI